MKVQQNIGIVNALIRIICGFTLLAWTTAKLVKKPGRESYILVAMLAAMKIGEGFLRYCPLTDIYESMNKGDVSDNQDEKQSDRQS
ncbi:DUF2892 domain-containing protein [Peribacillus cavernae]|uniref:DUF2892 domain-containing protein n=1 Tax=Peribacillus cavernae TaxID=1674310 RepID=A0A433HFY8_9BACI|nr:DUF2892 domain-containing protein [Peribacillus cavernae]MDQ0219837.1 hypothetical protein [Peribacillus cavernae]RUQ27228.1 DUF2892 domain-containing protein [Peribacillus cavernae]